MRKRSRDPGISLFAFQDIITAVVGIFILITLLLVLEVQRRFESSDAPQETISRDSLSYLAEAELVLTELQVQYEERLRQQQQYASINPLNRRAKSRQLESDFASAERTLESLRSELQEMQGNVLDQESLNRDLLAASAGMQASKNEIEELEKQLAEYSARKDQIESNQGVLYRDQVDSNRYVCIVQLSNDTVIVRDGLSKTKFDFRSIGEFDRWFHAQSVSSRHFLVLVQPSGVSNFDLVKQMLIDDAATFGFDLVSEGHEVALAFEWELQE